MLFTIHTVAAAALKMPAIKIPKDSCQELSEAILQVTELYEVPLMSEKQLAWMNLGSVAFRVYVMNPKQPVAFGPREVRKPVEPVPMPDFMSGKVM